MSGRDDSAYDAEVLHEDVKRRMKAKAKKIIDNPDGPIQDIYDLCVLNKMEEIYNPNKEENK